MFSSQSTRMSEIRERKPLGVFGGTFDPVHYGHLRLAEEAADLLALARVRWIPAGQPTARRPPQACAEQRLAMVARAIAGNARFELDRAEVDIRRNLGLVAPTAQHRLQDVVHALGEQAFHAPAVVELLAGHGQRGVLCHVGQQVALLVDHGDLRLAQFGNAGGDQIDNGQHLARLQRATGI